MSRPSTLTAHRASQPSIFGLTPQSGPKPAEANQDEDSRIQSMLKQSSLQWDQNQTSISQAGPPRKTFRPPPIHKFAPAGLPPSNYVCYRCGQRGHFINFCPTNNDSSFDRPRVRKSTGIPKSFLKPVQASDVEAGPVLVTADGQLVISTPNEREWDRLAATKAAAEATISMIQVPDEFKCPVCNKLFTDCVTVSCCGSTFCDECTPTRLVHDCVGVLSRCPKCGKDLKPEEIIENDIMRKRISEFLQQKTVPSSSPEPTITTPTPPASATMNASMPALPPFPFWPPFMLPHFHGMVPPMMPAAPLAPTADQPTDNRPKTTQDAARKRYRSRTPSPSRRHHRR